MSVIISNCDIIWLVIFPHRWWETKLWGCYTVVRLASITYCNACFHFWHMLKCTKMEWVLKHTATEVWEQHESSAAFPRPNNCTLTDLQSGKETLEIPQRLKTRSPLTVWERIQAFHLREPSRLSSKDLIFLGGCYKLWFSKLVTSCMRSRKGWHHHHMWGHVRGDIICEMTREDRKTYNTALMVTSSRRSWGNLHHTIQASFRSSLWRVAQTNMAATLTYNPAANAASVLPP